MATAMKVARHQLVTPRQVHGEGVLVRRSGDRTASADTAADIVISDDPTAAIAVQTADCVPLLIADRRTGAVAAAHAGWRGLAARVPQVAVEALARQFHSRPMDLVAAAGPAIGACCYEVGGDVRQRFGREGFTSADLLRWFLPSAQPTIRNGSLSSLPPAPRSDHWYFDPCLSARDQLETAGVPRDQIFVANLCTASHPGLLCSYRRDGQGAGRLAAAIRAASLVRR